jgi:hypothetical protein
MKSWDGGLRFGKSRKGRKSRKGLFDGSIRSKRRRGSKRFDGSLRPGRGKGRGWDGTVVSKGDKSFRPKRFKGYGVDRIISKALSHRAQIIHEDEQLLERQEEWTTLRTELVNRGIDEMEADNIVEAGFIQADRDAAQVQAKENLRQLMGGSVRRFSSMVERFLDRIYRP